MVSPETNTFYTLILDSQPPELLQNYFFCCLSQQFSTDVLWRVHWCATRMFFFNPHSRTFFIALRERAGERKRERERWMREESIDWLPSVCIQTGNCTSPTQDRTHSLGMRPDLESDPQTYGYRILLQQTETHRSGHHKNF